MITDTLKNLLANHIEGGLTVHGYHLNIEGEDFTQYHSLFGQIYQDFYSQIDVLGEYIRIISLGSEYVNISVDIIKLNKSIVSDPIVGSKPKEMCSAILKIIANLIPQFNILVLESKKEQEEGLLNYCAERLDKLNKLKWTLLSITK